MKKELLVVFFAAALWSCGDEAKDKENDGDKNHSEQHDEGEAHDHEHDHDHGATWVEAEAYHEYMASTWHPAEEGDFEPIMAKARDMANAAAAWAESDIPEEYNKEGVPELLQTLKTESEELADMVEEGADNETIYENLEALHNLFHKVVEECSGDDHHHHHHGDGHNHDHHDHDHAH